MFLKYCKNTMNYARASSRVVQQLKNRLVSASGFYYLHLKSVLSIMYNYIMEEQNISSAMEEKYIRRDYLAQDRTHLANERTLLAYWRTGLACIISGAFLLKFFSSIYAIITSLIVMILGTGLFVYGTRRFFAYKEKINKR